MGTLAWASSSSISGEGIVVTVVAVVLTTLVSDKRCIVAVCTSAQRSIFLGQVCPLVLSRVGLLPCVPSGQSATVVYP